MVQVYDQIPTGTGKITANEQGTYLTNDTDHPDLYDFMDANVKTGTINLLSSVFMVYDVSGNRVLKVAGR